jgi:hypothetical protein
MAVDIKSNIATIMWTFLSVTESVVLQHTSQYMIMPGNNSQLVLNALRARKWWAPANSSAIGNGGMHSGCVSGGPVGEIHTFFNFFWEQWSPPKRFSDLKAVPFCTQVRR